MRFFGHLERLLDQRPELLERDRLRQVIEGAGLQRGDRIFGAAISGDHRNRHIHGLLSDVFNDAQSFAIGQSHVGQAEIEWLPIEQPKRIADRFGARRVESHA